MHAHVRGWRLADDVGCPPLLYAIFEARSLTGWLASKLEGPSGSTPAAELQMYVGMPAFDKHGCWDLNAGLYACLTGTLPTEPSPQCPAFTNLIILVATQTPGTQLSTWQGVNLAGKYNNSKLVCH